VTNIYVWKKHLELDDVKELCKEITGKTPASIFMTRDKVEVLFTEPLNPDEENLLMMEVPKRVGWMVRKKRS